MQLRQLLSFLIMASMLTTQGCVAAAIGYGAYAISSSNDEAAQKEAEGRNVQTYNTYKSDAEKLNLDREKSGLKPQPIMTFAEWKLAHNITTPAPPPEKATTEKKE
ncbi:MAG: hypothetical protein NTY64_16140 [Deltaproteobacteria bacterium]|nr:hypothetical protein [Deltaproteobacteria bacterium]